MPHPEHIAPLQSGHAVTKPCGQHAVGSERAQMHGILLDSNGVKHMSQRVPMQMLHASYSPPMCAQHALNQSGGPSPAHSVGSALRDRLVLWLCCCDVAASIAS